VVGPWIIIGDFNLIRSSDDKISGHINLNLVSAFNSAIQQLGLLEIPLLTANLSFSYLTLLKKTDIYLFLGYRFEDCVKIDWHVPSEKGRLSGNKEVSSV
jgi:hypothetical protein